MTQNQNKRRFLMKKMYFRVPAGCFLFFLFYLVSFAHAEKLFIHVGEWPPYIESGTENKGFMSEIVINAFRYSGIEAALIFEPWKRVEYNVMENKAVSFGWYKNEERARIFHFSEEIVKSRVVFAKRKDRDIPWKSFNDLKPYKIGVTMAYSSGEEFDKFKSQLQIDEAVSDEVNLRKLLKGRFDLFTVDPIVGARLLRTKFSPEERGNIEFMTDNPLSSLGVHLLCAKSNDRCLYYIEKFNAGLAAVRAEGIKQKILDQAMDYQ
jgi:polar amino acid transport system substrate-binding protein